jgi:hypothetical protein
MTTLVQPTLDATTATNHWKRFGRWSGDAWRLFRRSPLRFLLLALLPLAVEAVIQAAPRVGIVLSKCVVPMFGMWVLLMIDAKARTERFAPLAALHALAARPAHVAMYVAFALVIFAFQVGAAALIGGVDQAVALATGNLAELHFTRREFALILAGGALPAALTMFAAPHIALSNYSVVAALRHGFALVARNPKPVAVYALCTMELLALMLVQPLLMLLVLPWFCLIGYTAYRDVTAA